MGATAATTTDSRLRFDGGAGVPEGDGAGMVAAELTAGFAGGGGGCGGAVLLTSFARTRLRASSEMRRQPRYGSVM